MAEKIKEIDRIIVRYLLNEADPAEKVYLLNWLKEDISNRQFFFSLKDIWENSQIDIAGKIKTNESLKALKEKIGSNSNHLSVTARRSIFYHVLKYAAVLLCLSILGITAFLFTQKKQDTAPQVSYNEILTENGQKKEITLPDGTRVWLNSGTAFMYPDNYGKTNREVYLTGEAYFEVTRDESQTFIVRAGDVIIKVLGTSFNVNCYPDNKMVETTVISGVVSIENTSENNENEVVILNKHEKGTYLIDQQKMLVEKTPLHNPPRPLAVKKISLTDEETAHIASWKDQTLSFNNETLEEMSVKLQRWFNVTVNIKDESLKQYRYKGKFENVRSVIQVLEVVKLATPITYEYNEKTKVITIKELKRPTEPN